MEIAEEDLTDPVDSDRDSETEGADENDAGKKRAIWQIDHRTAKPLKVDKNGRQLSEIPDEEPEPSHLDTNQLSKFLEVGTEKLSAKYTGSASHENDVGCISANCSVPKNRLYYYFEVEVQSVGQDLGTLKMDPVSIGFVDKPFKMGRHPGEELRSYGFTSDGFVLSHIQPDDRPRRDKYTTGFKEGDVVGAGIDLERREIFFTLNGEFLGLAFTDLVNQPWIPTVGLHSTSASVALNFGHEPYRFSNRKYYKELAVRPESLIQEQEVSPMDMRRHVLDHLKFYGYYKTLRLMEQSSKAEGITKFLPDCLEEDEAKLKEVKRYKPYKERIELQKSLRALISSRSPVDAYFEWKKRQNMWKDGHKFWPTLFLLSLAAFLHLVWQKRFGEAIDFARRESHPYLEQNSDSEIAASSKEMLLECFGLLAHNQPESTHLRSLLTVQQQENLFDGAVSWLLHDQKSLEGRERSCRRFSVQRWQSTLEQVLQQLYTVKRELRICNHNIGPFFSLEKRMPQNVATSGNQLMSRIEIPLQTFSSQTAAANSNQPALPYTNGVSHEQRENGGEIRENGGEIRENGSAPMDTDETDRIDE